MLRLIVLLVFALGACGVYAAEGDNEDDYFYEASLDKEQIKEIQLKKQAIELEEKSRLSTTTPADPAFFTVKQSQDQNIDWNKYYMDKMIAEYMKKFQLEQLEKRRIKFETDLNHPLLSIITLSLFFGISSIIGLLIAFFRGKQFRKNETTSQKKIIYDSVTQNENPTV